MQCALPSVKDEPDDRVVVILTGDAPLITSDRVAQLVEACEKSPAGLALLSTVPPKQMPYGRLVRDASGKLERIVEDVDATAEQRDPDTPASTDKPSLARP